MADLSLLKYPKKSHRKKVLLPKYSEQLAEFFGIMMGDGGINNSWQANITLNSVKDLSYSKYVFGLCLGLFRVKPALRKRKNMKALVISITSISIVDFLVQNGLPRGNKIKNGLQIPGWILKNDDYCRECVRGLIDTDGCLFIHIHKVKGKEYKNLGLSFTSYSKKVIIQVSEIFTRFSIKPHVTNKGRSIYLYSAEDVVKYLKVFDTSNERIENIYKKWRDARVV